MKWRGSDCINHEPKENLVNLKTLFLYNNEIENVDCISKLPNLSKLDLTGNNITNIDSLEQMESLWELYIMANSIENIEEVSKWNIYLDINDDKYN